MFKRLARIAADRSGAIQLVRRLNRNNVRILMYHRFPRQHEHNFDRQCAFLAANYNVVPLEEAAQRLRQDQPIANMAVITVDDGYADIHEVAFPILRKHRLPATLFVTTGFINRTSWMPGDRVRYHLAHTKEATVRVTDDAGKVHAFDTKEKHASDQLRALLKRVPEHTKKRILAEMDGNLPVLGDASMRDDYRPCSWSQLRQLADGGITIGAHTITHPILSRVESVDEIKREIVASKAELEDKLQHPVASFAYPNGMQEDINQVSVDCARAHFKAAVTAIPGLNAPGTDVYELLRLPCDPDVPVPQMARSLAGPIRRRAQQAALNSSH